MQGDDGDPCKQHSSFLNLGLESRLEARVWGVPPLNDDGPAGANAGQRCRQRAGDLQAVEVYI